MKTKASAETPWAELKRKTRAKPGGRNYERARGRTLVVLSRLHPDEYQDILRAEVRKEERKVKAAAKAAVTKAS